MRSSLLNRKCLERCPRISVVTTVLKSLWGVWWTAFTAYHPPYGVLSDLSAPLALPDLKKFDQQLADNATVAPEETAAAAEDGCHGGMYAYILDQKLGPAVRAQCTHCIIPRYKRSILKPLLRSYMQRCMCGAVTFVNERGRCVLWDDPTVVHEECEDAAFYRVKEMRTRLLAVHEKQVGVAGEAAT